MILFCKYNTKILQIQGFNRTNNKDQRRLDTGYWILDAGYWILDAGHWMLDTGYWTLDVWELELRVEQLNS